MWETLKEIGLELVQTLQMRRGAIRRIVSRILAIVAIACLVEVFVFNFNHFASAGYDSIDLTDQLEGQLPKTADGDYRITAIDHAVTFTNLNKDVHNIVLQFDAEQPAQVVTVRIHFTDSAHSSYFDTNEYSLGVPDALVATNVDESYYLNLNTSGYTDNLRIEMLGDDLVYPVTLHAVYLNGHHPFHFNVFRFLLLAGVLALLYVFRPRSGMYKWQITEHPGRSKALIALSVAFELYLMATFMLFGSSLVGVATATYNSGSWDRSSVVNSFEVGGDNAQQYAELARAFADGQLYLEVEPPAWLQEMDDPYDKGARDELMKETGEEYLWDTAYYDGHYYVYFGVVPCLIFYLPFYLLTGSNFPTAIGVLLACIAFVVGITMLLWRFAYRHFRRVSVGVFLLLQMPLVFCSGVLYLLKFPTFYALPIMCALAFSVWGLLFWMAGRSSGTPCRWYLAGSLCMALVFGCRPQLMVLSLVAFPLFWRRYITERRLFTPQGVRELFCLLAPYAVVFAGIMAYNAARFGSPLNFGANYNLTMNDMTQRGFSVGRLAPALFAFLLQPPSTTGVFPWVQPVEFATTYLGQTIREVTFGGIFACLPVLWTIFFARPILKMRVRGRNTHTVAGVIVIMLTMGVVVACLDAQGAGILQRYYADFSFMFLAAAVLLVFIANENLDPWSSRWLMLLKVLVAMTALSLAYSWLVCLVSETGWVSDIYPWAYRDLIETFQFWT